MIHFASEIANLVKTVKFVGASKSGWNVTTIYMNSLLPFLMKTYVMEITCLPIYVMKFDIITTANKTDVQ